MRGGSGINPRRRSIIAGALGAAVWPGLALAQGKDAARNREVYLYKGAIARSASSKGRKKSARSSSTLR